MADWNGLEKYTSSHIIFYEICQEESMGNYPCLMDGKNVLISMESTFILITTPGKRLGLTRGTGMGYGLSKLPKHFYLDYLCKVKDSFTAHAKVYYAKNIQSFCIF